MLHPARWRTGPARGEGAAHRCRTSGRNGNIGRGPGASVPGRDERKLSRLVRAARRDLAALLLPDRPRPRLPEAAASNPNGPEMKYIEKEPSPPLRCV